MSALCLLDLTAAFYTVDHELLLLRLERQFGLRGTVLAWFRSYLSDRTFRVKFSSSTSSIVYIVCSVPQGSVLGPLLFIVYTADLEDTAEKHGVSVHAFADDTQLYLHCRFTDTALAAGQLEQCIADVGRWMSANRLKLNKDKTELLWIGSRHNLSQQGCCLPVLQLGSDTTTACDHVRFAGCIILRYITDVKCQRRMTPTNAPSPQDKQRSARHRPTLSPKRKKQRQ